MREMTVLPKTVRLLLYQDLMQYFDHQSRSLNSYLVVALLLLLGLNPALQPSSSNAQSPVTNRTLSGKGAAPSDTDRAFLTSEIPSATWVRLRPDGSFTARIFELSESAAHRLQTGGSATLSDLSGTNQLQHPDHNGNITFKGLKPGIYCLTYKDLGRFLQSAIHLVNEAQDDERHLESSIDLWCTSYSRREVDAILLPYLLKPSDTTPLGIDRRKVPGVLEQRKLRDAGQSSIQDAQHIPTIQLDDDVLDGVVYRPGTSSDPDRVFNPLKNGIILLVNGNTILSSEKTDDNGFFSIDSVLPGKYALLLHSEEGSAAIGLFVASANKEVAQVDLHSERFVSRLTGGGGLGIQASPNLPNVQTPAPSSFAGSPSMSPTTPSGSGSGIAPASAMPNAIKTPAESLAEAAEGDSAAPNLQPREASTATPPE